MKKILLFIHEVLMKLDPHLKVYISHRIRFSGAWETCAHVQKGRRGEQFLLSLLALAPCPHKYLCFFFFQSHYFWVPWMWQVHEVPQATHLSIISLVPIDKHWNEQQRFLKACMFRCGRAAILCMIPIRSIDLTGIGHFFRLFNYAELAPSLAKCVAGQFCNVPKCSSWVPGVL